MMPALLSAAVLASGCGAPAAPPTSFAGRPLVVHVPRGYDGSKRVPLVLNLHGSGSDAAQEELFTGMDGASDADGFLLAYPQGAIPFGGGYVWNVGASTDVTYLARLVKFLESRYCVDAKRVYATGFSGGARMASRLACDLSATFAAVAPISGLRFPSPCRSTRPVPVLSMHGTADPVDPYAGHGQPYWAYSVPVAARRWAAHDRCAPAPATGKPAAGTTLTRYVRCAGGASVELYTIAGEGHEWPGGPPLPLRITRALGPQSDAIDANAVVWRFFAAHPLR